MKATAPETALRVILCEALVVPAAKDPKLKEAGATDKDAATLEPLPVKTTPCGELVIESLKIKTAPRVPAA